MSATASPFLSGAPPMHTASEKRMGKSHTVAAHLGARTAQVGVEERTVVQERLSAFLIGLYPVKTTENVSADTGISGNTISKWLDRGSAPSAWAMLRLLDAYGAEFAVAVMTKPPAWVCKAAREQKRQRLDDQIASLKAQQAQLDGGL